VTVTTRLPALQPTAVADTYWRFAAERQRMYLARLAGDPPPWTTDAVLAAHRFTNSYRASDRVSQYLITQVSYRGSQDPDEVLFRTLLFRIFNKPATWQALMAALGAVSWDSYGFRPYSQILAEGAKAGPVYNNAYVMPPVPAFDESRKYQQHLRLIEYIMNGTTAALLTSARTATGAFNILSSSPGIGPFLAYQILTDLGYSEAFPFDESEFAMPGPGALDGIAKCFGKRAARPGKAIIRYMAETQDEHFARLGLEFPGLRGRPLQLIDIQNLFCEISKYARVVHPDIPGISKRSRIKQRYQQPDPSPLTAWFPPKWGLGDSYSNIPGNTS
jgi:hypothetical protein